jgi:hypothetical protein
MNEGRDVYILMNAHTLLVEGNFSDESAHTIKHHAIKTTIPMWSVWTNQTKW